MKPFLDWSRYENAGLGDAYADIPKEGGDFAKAVAVCINSQQCQTLKNQVMCPSYRVTHNPTFSTGGRVRLLKAALNGKLPLDDPQLAAAMDWCVSCKGCQRECESNVDMALIKAEYYAQLRQQKGTQWRQFLFAYLPDLFSYRPFHWLLQWRHRSAFLRFCGEYFFRVYRGNLPIPAPQKFMPQRQSTPIDLEKENDHRDVVLWIDTFNCHFEPQVMTAAETILRTAGYRLHFVQQPKQRLCCGRSFLSQGFIDQARKSAQQVVDVLLPYAKKEIPIIGLEPSCLLMLRDDYRALGMGEEGTVVGKQALLLEEFLAREAQANRLKLTFRPLTTPVLVHGHCHQKAAGAMKSMRRVLALIPELKFELINASCCGMAGSFGYEAEHAPLGRKMAEESLIPAVQAQPQAIVVANGFSCRQQLLNYGVSEPLHVAQLLAWALNLEN